MSSQAKHIVVHGRVQGVGFRYFVYHTGSRLGLVGNVSNSPDGTVDIFVEGSPKRIKEFLHEIEKGPTMARVERMEVHDVPAEGNYGSFSIEGW